MDDNHVFACAGHDISRIGNDAVKTNNVADGHAVFLLAETVQKPGTLFAYRAYIANAGAMLVLQLWRPVSPSSQRQFELVDVVHYSPTSVNLTDVR